MTGNAIALALVHDGATFGGIARHAGQRCRDGTVFECDIARGHGIRRQSNPRRSRQDSNTCKNLFHGSSLIPFDVP